MAKCDTIAYRALLALFVMVLSSQIDIVHSKKLEVDVYYSPMDLKSGKLIKESVAEMSKNMLDDFVNLNLYPVAGCTLENSKLTCNGGDSEANATLAQACAFDVLSPVVDNKRDATNGLQYISCTMNPPKVNVERCADQIKDVKDKVEKCISDKVTIVGMMTNYKRFDVDYKPFVVIDDKQSKTQDQAAMKAWKLTICRALGVNVPIECNSLPNFKRGKRGDTPPPAEGADKGGADAAKDDKKKEEVPAAAAAAAPAAAAAAPAGGEAATSAPAGGAAADKTHDATKDGKKKEEEKEEEEKKKGGVAKLMMPSIGTLMVLGLGLIAAL